MDTSSILQWISAIGSIVTPILIVIIGAMLSRNASKQEKIIELQLKLQDDRTILYSKILEPFIIAATPKILLAKDKRFSGKDSGEAASTLIMKPEYKLAEFKLLFWGSDEVVKAYNSVKIFAFSGQPDGTEESTKKFIQLISNLIIEMRQGITNEKTKLSFDEIIWWFTKDANKFLNIDQGKG
jgi:hypothetical protein